MKLVINISSIGPRSTGLGHYALQHARFAARAFDAEVIAAEGVTGFDQVVLRAPATQAIGAGRSAALRRWVWGKRQRAFPKRIMYSPTHHGLYGADSQIRTVHDLISLRFPRQHPTQYAYFKYALPRELARCAALFTVSEVSRHDIHETYGFPLDRIFVVPNGVDRSVFHPAASDSVINRDEPFLLVVGASYAHKNVEELITHASSWRDIYRLKVVSCRGRYRRRLLAAVRAARLETRVDFVDYAPLGELVRLYQTCAALVNPSRWEGFGIPPLEALACGAPVIVSDIPAHREVLGAHASYVRLGDAAAWHHTLSELSERSPRPVSESASLLEHYTWSRAGDLLVRHLLDVEPRLLLSDQQPAAIRVAS